MQLKFEYLLLVMLIFLVSCENTTIISYKEPMEVGEGYTQEERISDCITFPACDSLYRELPEKFEYCCYDQNEYEIRSVKYLV